MGGSSQQQQQQQIDVSRMCGVGLMTTDHYDDLPNFIQQAEEAGHEFVVIPISHPTFRRVLNENNSVETQAHEAWKERPMFNIKDLVIKSAEWSSRVVGLLPNWIQLESSNSDIKLCSEIALKQEIDWACHIGLPGVLFPTLPKKGSLKNTARVIQRLLKSMTITQLMVQVPLTYKENIQGNLPWKRWNQLRALCNTEYQHRLSVALEITPELPSDELLLNMWIAEPVKAVIVRGETFVPNAKGYPVLPKPHQRFLQKLMDKLKPDFIVTVPNTPLHEKANPSSYCEYIHYLNRHLPLQTEEEQFATGYHDYLQAPLQPLMDNLENQTYEVFEKDPVKYQQYEKAVYKALLDRVEHGSDYVTTIMVVGAGRGPLVDRCLQAAEKSERKVFIYALEKNPNAFVTLQNKKTQQWGDRVELVFADMRQWNPPKQCDILVSELLGSFGDNELSPECLDGAQKFIKEDGISIPASYTSYISPLASSRIFGNINLYKDIKHFETPYVVLFQQVCELAAPQSLWSFKHPNDALSEKQKKGQHINTNLHNVRHAHVEFKQMKHDMIMHGLAGYFECELYGDVTLSILPSTHSPNMFSWFPIFFPLQKPVQVLKDSTVSVDFWRLTDESKIWFEWSVSVENEEGDMISTSTIHNANGRSSYVGL
ncbi:PRMT5 arginine-N-methyltransferase-domain-containing protein [Mycotypha africana]|uniref:PRMT5 arginine-N-methyltransferase-domain-containing protein n=1 Tax=Mycotypha africana TaxID=64632 RepID=UPI0023018111|nr:PRMT5 arginine-N-methyltransferase-domain-containing protein [Mycotypha africana]KAI8984574.1 PRMT5 arginine-N-methyltransferase-domain-containing protein [Mycotypha africana]